MIGATPSPIEDGLLSRSIVLRRDDDGGDGARYVTLQQPLHVEHGCSDTEK